MHDDALGGHLPDLPAAGRAALRGQVDRGQYVVQNQRALSMVVGKTVPQWGSYQVDFHDVQG